MIAIGLLPVIASLPFSGGRTFVGDGLTLIDDPFALLGDSLQTHDNEEPSSADRTSKGPKRHPPEAAGSAQTFPLTETF